jgi:iron complex outermembrane receptor protein
MPPFTPGLPRHRWLAAIRLILCLTCTALYSTSSGRAAAEAAEEAKKAYHITAGDATETLKRFAQQSGREIVYPVEQVRGVQTRAVQGEFTAVEALTRMLAGTDLQLVQDKQTGALSVTRRAPAEKPGPAPDTPAATAAPPPEVLRLPDFAVNTVRDDSYVGREALSTTRTGVELLDLPQSVKVINRAMIDDINPGLVVDILKYVGGGQAGNINFADDRFTLRGFNSPADIGDFVDGFRAKLDSNTDTAIIERLEIIKGPSAIFVANGPVGGVINKITKSPVSYPLRTLRLQAGLFDANRAELDLGGPVTADGKLLYRFVLAGQDSNGWYDHTYTQRIILAPSLAYSFTPHTRLTFKYFYFDFRFSSYNGIPFDERTGRPLAIDPQSSFSEPKPLNWRKDIAHRFLAEFTHRLNHHAAVRLAGFHTHNNAGRVESVNGSSIPASFVNGTLIPRSTTAQDRDHYRTHFQGDLVFNFDTGPAGHRLLAGGELSNAPDEVRSYAGTSSPVDPFNLRVPGSVTVNWATPSGHTRSENRQQKLFALETLSLFNQRLQLSAGGSRVRAKTSSRNKLTGTTTPSVAVTETLLQYGVLFKATPGLSLFYGYNENFAPNFTATGSALPSQLGKQREVGLKADLPGGRLSATLSHFDIQQQNVPVLSFPQTTPPSFVLVPGQSSRGVDGDIAFKATDRLDFIATFAFLDAKARSQANSAAPVIVQPVNNVAETTLGLWTRYKVTTGTLKGLSVGLGISHLSKRAITTNNNATLYGYLPGFTVADLVLAYETRQFRYGVNIYNLFDKDYYAAVRNQSIIIPGAGTNLKASLTWKF